MAPQPPAALSPTCILNGKSVHLQAALVHIPRISGQFNVATQVLVTKRGDNIPSLAARALAERRQPVVAGGGDGTVNAVAGKLVGTDTALGVLPMGTLNHFARDAGIPLDLETAICNLFTGHIRKLDVGEVNGRVFVNNSGIGFYPHFVRQREELERRGYVKRFAALVAMRALLRRYMRLRLNLHMDQAQAFDHLTPFLFVGDNRYETSGSDIGTRHRLDSGRLWVCTAHKTDRLNLWRAALRTLIGRATDQDLNAFEADELSVDPGTARVTVSTDGEVSLMDAPLRYRIRPHALGVIVPQIAASGLSKAVGNRLG